MGYRSEKRRHRRRLEELMAWPLAIGIILIVYWVGSAALNKLREAAPGLSEGVSQQIRNVSR
jgi:hypothetical protein